MENRFGVKDLFLFLLIGALIVLVVLAMYQFDRQYAQVLDIKQQNTDLTRDVFAIKRQLAQGVPTLGGAGPAAGGGAGGATTQPGQAAADAFTYVRRAEQMPGFARGDWFIDNFSTKIGKLTPLTSSDIYQKWVESQVLEGLTTTDPYTVEEVPRLAARWEQSPDGLTIRYHLRRGVEFSDGHPLTADDVVFTFDWIRNPDVNADRVRSYLTDLKDVKKIDDYTVEFTFAKYYFGTLVQLGSIGIMPRHFYSQYTPDQFNEQTGLLMGSGPYKLESPTGWTPTGQGVVLVRNERYWGTPATFDRILFKEVQGEATEMVMYGNQETDLIRCVPEQYEKLKSDPRVMSFSNSFAYDFMYGGYVYCGWNQVRVVDGKEVRTVFADARVRRAMTLLLDRERMAKEIFLGYATPATGPFSPQSPQYDQTVKPWPHDEAAARRLLAEAGFADRNGDGVLDGPDGRPFKFTLTYPSGSETWEKVVLSMKDSYARAGILLEPDRVDWPVLVQKLNTSNFDAVTLGWSSVPEDDPYQIFHSDSIKGQGDNRTHYTNPELDRLIEQARGTVDKARRMELWHQVHRILHEDQPYTFLFDRKALRLIHKRIHNVRTSTVGLNFEYLNGGMIPWFVPAGEQRYATR